MSLDNYDLLEKLQKLNVTQHNSTQYKEEMKKWVSNFTRYNNKSNHFGLLNMTVQLNLTFVEYDKFVEWQLRDRLLNVQIRNVSDDFSCSDPFSKSLSGQLFDLGKIYALNIYIYICRQCG